MIYTLKFFENVLDDEPVEVKTFTGDVRTVIDETDKYLTADLEFRSFEIELQFDNELERRRFQRIVEVER